jgi:cytochrome c-type biogenesis protein CcmH/NrfF
MSRNRSIAVCACFLAVTLAGGAGLRADQNDRAHQVGAKLKCMCGGCDQSAAKCYHVGGSYSGPCDTAKGMLREIDGHIAKGLTDEQVLAKMIEQYGTLAYLEPPKSGFGLLAWLMPALYLLAGTVLVMAVMKRWRKRSKSAALQPAGPPVPPELLARARALAERETED